MRHIEPTYYPWMDDDTHLAELFREAELARPWYMRVDWFKLIVWAVCLGYCWLFWYGVAKAL